MPWIWRQSWCDLAFLHWPVPVEVIRPLVPRGLNVQAYDGTAWVGVVPFRMEGVMRRPWPDMPWVSAFPELNVRTYVEHDGKPGVWFFSLDATNALAVFAARRWFHLPYHRAEIAVQPGPGGRFDYRLKRFGCGVAFEGSYAPTGEPWHAKPGTIEHFLTERYCLYAQRPDGRVLRVEVHHAPWPLQHAELELRASTMTQPWQLTLEKTPTLVHFAKRVDVVAWPPELLTSQAQAPQGSSKSEQRWPLQPVRSIPHVLARTCRSEGSDEIPSPSFDGRNGLNPRG